MKTKLIWKLLKTNLSKSQIGGYALANIVGLTVILCGLLFFFDSRHPLNEEDAYFSNDYVVVSKKINGFGTVRPIFDADDIADLQQQPGVKRVGRFTPSLFPVSGAINVGGQGFTTHLFLESVPDDFFDSRPAGFDFDPSRSYVPVIISKDYLALYNYGFAIPQGLPQASEQLVKSIPMQLTFTASDGHTETFGASIVGFSSRLNTFAVPQSFMDWANRRYAPDSEAETSRLILEIDPLQASSLGEYLDSNNIEIGGNRGATGKVADFLNLISTVVTVGGAVISLLALFILLLSIFLLLQKSREKLRNLILLGYTPWQLTGLYSRFFFAVNLAVVVISLGASFALRTLWADPLADLGLGGTSPLPLLLLSALYLLLLTLLNTILLRRGIR